MDAALETLSITDNFFLDFEIHEDEILGNSSAHIREIRKKAIVSFEKLGIPTRKHEEWKYTDINSILKNEYVQLFTPVDTDLTANDIYPFLTPDLDAYIAVVENGRYVKQLSSSEIKDSVILSSFAEAINHHSDVPAVTAMQAGIVEKHFSNYADINSDAFIALNTAFAQDGVFIFVPDGVTVDKPIHIVNVINTNIEVIGTSENLFVQPRNLFVIGANSRVQIIESFSVISNLSGLSRNEGQGQSRDSKANNIVLTNAVTEIICGKNSNVDHYIIQNEHGDAECRDEACLVPTFRVSTTQVYQEANSVFSTNTITLNGAFVRNNLNIVPDAEGCETNLYGLYLLKDKQHVDNHTLVDHKKPNCYSNELYIGILDGKSTGVFNGKVHVRKDAQKTNAFQSNKNILLTDDACINTKPQLEIYADDVKCSHGATTGQLDREALFYLRSRGIGEDNARAMLMHAFTCEIIDNIKIEPLKHKLDKLIAERLSATDG